MKNNNKFENLVHLYTQNLLDLLKSEFTDDERSYGFEYEFISTRPLTPEDMKHIYRFLSSCGFHPNGDILLSDSGMYITFEPGGQIEYCSPPVLKADDIGFHRLMRIIAYTNKAIKEALGIEYVGRGYIPGRADAPMILKAKRYHYLHGRMMQSGTRGREMMKGTASIHLHARILNMEDVVPLYKLFRELSQSEEFKMSPERRDIWNHTDPSRCGLAVKTVQNINTPEDLIKEMVRFAVKADDIEENIPFAEKKDTRFDEFLYHMTTMFTDVRLNMKGPSWELRTLDSLPLVEFEKKWKTFIRIIENAELK